MSNIKHVYFTGKDVNVLGNKRFIHPFTGISFIHSFTSISLS